MPPVWMASELMSFGQLSHWYAALKEPAVRQSIANPFALDETVFVPFVHHLSVIRNICAHHGRLWNRTFRVPLRLPRRRPEMVASAVNRTAPTNVYNTLAMIHFVLRTVEPKADWSKRLASLIETLPVKGPEAMGFAPDWQGHTLWKPAA